MPNPFFQNTQDLLPSTKARAGDVESNFDAVEAGFDEVEQYANRSLRGARSDGLINALPNEAARANRVLSFDVSGQPSTAITAEAVMSAEANAVAAAGSASAAAGSASSASTSATSALGSASAASASATNAANSASAASGSQAAAAASASAASSSATSASDSASAASTSASNAAASASAALTSQTNAASSASSASTSAAAASTSAAAAALYLDSFDDRYLGPKASAPTLDNDGNALLTGALYFDTTANAMYVWTGTIWAQPAPPPGVVFAYDQYFSGNGSQTAFTLSPIPSNPIQVHVFISGVRQGRTAQYTISGSTLTFVTAPPSGTNNIYCVWSTPIAEVAAVTTGMLNDGAVSTAKLASTIAPVVTSINSGQLAGMRNKIINGKMEIAQRGTSFPAIASGAYSLDRWAVGYSTSAVVTVAQGNDGPSLSNLSYLSAAVTTADASIAASDIFVIRQRIEGFNARDLAGRSFTLSFLVKSSKTGVHCVAFRNAGADRSYVAEYTISAANTWQQHSVTVNGGLIPAGTWDWSVGIGVDVVFTLAAGSTFQTTAGAWQTGNFLATANQVNCLDTVGNIFAITGVQLEVGSVATPFEHRPYGTELALCQRYHQQSGLQVYRSWGSGGGEILATPITFPVVMRAIPTIAYSLTFTGNVSAVDIISPNAHGFSWRLTTVGAGMCELQGSPRASAEL